MRKWRRLLDMLSFLAPVLLASCSVTASTVSVTTATATMTYAAATGASSVVKVVAGPEDEPRTPTPPPTRERIQRSEEAKPTDIAPTSTTPAPAMLVNCSRRMPHDEDLLTLVTRDFGLSRDYEPGDLVPLGDYFPNSVTLGYPTEVRAAIITPLQEIMQVMQDEGFAPQIVSGYRSYSAQTLARQKWVEQYPDWAHNLSAPPGHSEHQLGTTVDFGSPELEIMLGEEYVQFHPAFAQTSEGQWLAEHAPEYGFTMSYPADAFERTTFYYEPWHFRYVGTELATILAKENLTISEFLEWEQPAPCLVD